MFLLTVFENVGGLNAEEEEEECAEDARLISGKEEEEEENVGELNAEEEKEWLVASTIPKLTPDDTTVPRRNPQLIWDIYLRCFPNYNYIYDVSRIIA